MKKLKAWLPHLGISMLLVLVLMVVLDEYNPAMGYLNSNTAKIYMLLLSAVCLTVCMLSVIENRKRPAVPAKRPEAQREREKPDAPKP